MPSWEVISVLESEILEYYTNPHLGNYEFNITNFYFGYVFNECEKFDYITHFKVKSTISNSIINFLGNDTNILILN